MGAHMKTTIEINDELFRSARQRAADTGTTLRALVEDGLRSVLARGSEPPCTASFQLRVLRDPAGDTGLMKPYDRLGLHQAILDSYREVDGDAPTGGAVHDRD
jgi:Bacterial antitoxin of type II TA system, VapB